MKHYLNEGGKKEGNGIIKKEKHRRLFTLLIFIALKVVSTNFLSNFYFPLNDSPSNIMKKVFYFI